MELIVGNSEGGSVLRCIPDQYKTPDACLRMVKLNPAEKHHVPFWVENQHNLYSMAQRLENYLGKEIPYVELKRLYEGGTYTHRQGNNTLSLTYETKSGEFSQRFVPVAVHTIKMY